MYKISLIVFLAFFLQSITVEAQISETFSDGDFTNNPTWTGGTGDWIVNGQMQLQSNNTVANGAFYLSTPSTLAGAAQWEMTVSLTFNTSSTNYVDAFLTASAADITNSSTTGYFVRLGGTTDEISLYRKDGSSITRLIDGADNVLNHSSNVMRIKVVRMADNTWTLQHDSTGTGNLFISEGTASDATYTTSAYFGFSVKQSTSSFFQRHFFDDIQVQAYVPDATPPAVQTANTVTATQVDVLFSENVDAVTAETLNNYVVNNGIGQPSGAVRDAVNQSLVHLTFTTAFANNTANTLTVTNIKDIAGNTLLTGTTTFSLFNLVPYAVVIDEIFADPTPSVGLPNAEFIELKNTTGTSINLQGWKVNSLSSASAAFPDYILPADSFLIITGTSGAALLSSYGRVIGISSFPSLDNAGTTLWLTSKDGLTVHSVSYNVSWFQNDVKSDGGWTLEMIDTKNPCSGIQNWKASTNLSGGTPGTENSINADNPDAVAPGLIRAAALDSLTLELTFSEPVDTDKGGTAANYSIDQNIGTPVSALAVAPSFYKVLLTLATPVKKGTIYTITASNIADCSGNIIQALKTARVGLPDAIDSFGIVINEILFNPKPTAVDYLEIYNRSSKIYNLKDLYIANRSTSTNAIGSLQKVTNDNVLLFPGDFFVLSENGEIVRQNYIAKNPDNFIDITMPSFSDDEGIAVLLNSQGKVVDELHYSYKWHFAIIDNEEGISLERIDYNKPTQSQSNWFSAASSVGFGTPTYQNSQNRTDVTGQQGDIRISPKTFSPDNDGFEDFTIVSYKLSEPNYVANITIYDAAGRAVKSLAKNATLALSGSFRWDGLDDKFNKIPTGAYVVYTEIFNLAGKRKSFKNVVVVAARF